MKIYIIPVETKYFDRPKINPFCPHSFGYNVETDFHKFLLRSDHLTNDPEEADWHYLPIYWSYWQLKNDYGRINRDKMVNYLKEIVTKPERTFTVSEADNEPSFVLPLRVFSANTHKEDWTFIPEITLPHAFPEILPEKKYLASFVGSFRTHPVRKQMSNVLRDVQEVRVSRSENTGNEKDFVNTILESYISLCPRGSAIASYRFYESMQLGVCPLMIAEHDIRPFKDVINWDLCSMYTDDVNEVPEMIGQISKTDLLIMGRQAQVVWNLLFNSWQDMIIERL